MAKQSFDNIAGKKFGKLTAVAPTGVTINGKKQWHCVCECGGTRDVLSTNLTRGNVKSCGCIGRGCAEGVNLAGRRFGTLTAIRRVKIHLPGDKEAVLRWECRCDCGDFVYRESYQLKTPHYHACDSCLSVKRAIALIENAGYANGTQIPKLMHENQTSNNRTGIRGVYYYPEKDKYRASITFKGKWMHLGWFRTLEDAARERRNAEQEYFENFLENIEEKKKKN